MKSQYKTFQYMTSQSKKKESTLLDQRYAASISVVSVDMSGIVSVNVSERTYVGCSVYRSRMTASTTYELTLMMQMSRFRKNLLFTLYA